MNDLDYLALLGPCIDQFGLITQTAEGNWDGGDSLQREGMFAICIECLFDLGMIDTLQYIKLKKRYRDNLNRLNCSAGNYKRHLDPSMWYSYPDRMSRDQWIPNVIATGLMDMPEHRSNLFWGHLWKRGLLFTTNTRRNGAYPPGNPKWNASQNYSWKLPDITVLSSWGYYIRAYKFLPLYPLLFVTDLELLINSIIWLINFKFNPTNTDILNHTNGLIQARKTMPTPISWLARKILPVGKVIACISSYFANNGPRIDLPIKVFLRHLW